MTCQQLLHHQCRCYAASWASGKASVRPVPWSSSCSILIIWNNTRPRNPRTLHIFLFLLHLSCHWLPPHLIILFIKCGFKRFIRSGSSSKDKPIMTSCSDAWPCLTTCEMFSISQVAIPLGAEVSTIELSINLGQSHFVPSHRSCEHGLSVSETCRHH